MPSIQPESDFQGSDQASQIKLDLGVYELIAQRQAFTRYPGLLGLKAVDAAGRSAQIIIMSALRW